ncbi:MAG: 3-deoxy-7-phosphoheptulonate synthase [Acidobacteria bacterium]|nr:3-deoxy-7-phosphoheptulonate synthase [Acidobacteriota bacterium]MCA1638206.1 3-deoxy-7-phosphoheptulonate synthase [Acidobacteriota bacterium]
MLIVMKPGVTQSEIEHVLEKIKHLGFCTKILINSSQTSIDITDGKGSIDAAIFENLTGVAETVRPQNPYKLASSQTLRKKSVVLIGNERIGGDELTIIGGVCAVETREQVFNIAETVKKSGAKFFRGGAFKPRTSPYAFQGLGEEGLRILAEVRSHFNLHIVTEAMDNEQVELVEKYADIIQIGTRNMQNFSLLKRVGKSKLPILLKRGMSATLEEFLLAAEYIMAEGNENVILCERGIRTFSNHARNTLDLSIIPAVQKLSHLPIIVDPSHGTGKNFMVTPMAMASVAAGADGLLIEVHPSPENALSDGAQALYPEQFLELVKQVKVIHEVLSPVTV